MLYPLSHLLFNHFISFLEYILTPQDMPTAFRRKGTPKSTSTTNDSTTSSSSTTASTSSLQAVEDGTTSTTTIATSSTTTTSSSPSLLGNFKGVKAWTGGIHLTSVGLRDLDVIIGGSSSGGSGGIGGQPLGTCIWIQEDRWMKDLSLSIAKYWIAEGIAQDQRLIIPIETNKKKKNNDDEEEEEGRLAWDWEEPSSSFESSRGKIFPTKEDVTEFLLSLPSNLNWEKQEKKLKEEERKATAVTEEQQDQQRSETLEKTLDILEEEEEEDDDDNEAVTDEGLKVAWQYKLSVQRERLGMNKQQQATATGNNNCNISNVFCHSYNLSGRMKDQQRDVPIDSYMVEMKNSIHHHESSSSSSPSSRASHPGGMVAVRELISMIRTAAAATTTARDGGKVIRLLFFHTDLAWLARALPFLLICIRKDSLPVVTLICSPPTSDPKISNALSKSVDVVLSTEGFASRKEYPPPAEFRHLQGLLKVSKLSTVTAVGANGGGHFADLTMSKRPTAYIYGCKRDHRKLHLPLLHIPPEDYAEGGGSVGSGGVRSGAGRPTTASTDHQPRTNIIKKTGTGGCGSNMTGSPLDF